MGMGREVLVLILVIVSLAGVSDAVRCFQCSATSPGSPCESDVELLIKEKQNGGPFCKNCSIEMNQHFCMIEASHSKGKLTTFVRDCSDGQTFSFDSISRLHNLSPTNQTTCATYGTSGTIVCISVCRTDFCNGPQVTSAATTTIGVTHKHLIIFLLVYLWQQK